MTLDGNGNVGIGTTAASAKLTIGNNVATGFLDNYSEYQQILYDAGTAGLSYGLGIKNSTIIFNSGSGAYSFDRAGAATSMYIDTSGNLGIGTTAPGRQVEIYGTSPLLKFNGHANGEPRTLGSNDYGFVIHNDNDGRYDMVIDNSGNLGIGTTAPAAKLEISDGTYPIRFTPGEFGIISTPAWGSNLEFKTTQSGGTVNNGQLFLEDTGRVGIGTTAPVAHFQVDQFRAGGYSTASISLVTARLSSSLPRD